MIIFMIRRTREKTTTTTKTARQMRTNEMRVSEEADV
jgi:hypothetical protein